MRKGYREDDTFIGYDPEIDALHIELGTTVPVDSIEIAPGTTVDLDANGKLIALEVLDVSEHLGRETLNALIVKGLTTVVRSVELEPLSVEAMAAVASALRENSPTAPTGTT